jgi:hypothetical protein
MANRGFFLVLLVLGIFGALDARGDKVAWWQSRAVSRRISNPFNEPMFTDKEQQAIANLMKLQEHVSFFDRGGVISVHLGRAIPNEAIGSHLRQISKIHTVMISPLKDALTVDSLRHLNGVRMKCLCLMRQPINDAGMKQVSQFTSLERLALDQAAVSDQGLMHIAQMPNLKVLEVWGSRDITDEALKTISTIPNLEAIRIGQCPKITNAGITRLAGIRSLRSVQISYCPEVTTDVLSILTRANKITRLSFGGLNFTADHLKDLEAFSDLQTLSIIECGLDDAAVKRIANCGRLRELRICNTKITDEAMRHIEKLNRLEELDVSNTAVTDVGLNSIRLFEDLEELNLQGTKITDPGLTHLGRMRRLKHLYIGDTRIGDGGMAKIKHLHGLQILLLSNTAVSDAGIAELTGMRNLFTLSLLGTKVTDGGADRLKAVLPKLDILGKGLTPRPNVGPQKSMDQLLDSSLHTTLPRA